MNEQRLLLEDVLRHNSSYDTGRIETLYRQAIERQTRKIFVLDDDPTGIQTTHDVYVYTHWDEDTLTEAFQDPYPISYLMTNTRALGARETEALIREVTESIVRVSERLGREFIIMSRGDSTLRGHYPLETATVRNVLTENGITVDGEILIPFFEEGGRYTAEDMHYLTPDRKTLIPVGESEFARDWTFSYHASDLKAYIEEKTKGEFRQEDVMSVSLAELEALDYAGIRGKLLQLRDFGKLILNCTSYTELKIFFTAFIDALASGKNYIIQSAASATRVLSGRSERPLLSREELTGVNDFGLIVIGSHVQRTNAQFRRLRECHPELTYIEFDITGVLEPERFAAEQERVQKALTAAMERHETTVLYTSREDFTVNSGNQEDELRAAVQISQAVTSFVEKLQVQPGFIIAKGGITSSGIGTRALGVRRALALGQILPGVPVWQLGPESKFTGTSFTIFPGNVGSEDALNDAVEKLIP